MATSSCAPAPTPAITVAIGSLHGCLLTITPEAAPRDVLEQASCHFAAAKALLSGMAEGHPDDSLWGVYHLLDMGKSLMDGAIVSIR